jgi:hypothetical protein
MGVADDVMSDVSDADPNDLLREMVCSRMFLSWSHLIRLFVRLRARVHCPESKKRA